MSIWKWIKSFFEPSYEKAVSGVAKIERKLDRVVEHHEQKAEAQKAAAAALEKSSLAYHASAAKAKKARKNFSALLGNEEPDAPTAPAQASA